MPGRDDFGCRGRVWGWKAHGRWSSLRQVVEKVPAMPAFCSYSASYAAGQARHGEESMSACCQDISFTLQQPVHTPAPLTVLLEEHSVLVGVLCALQMQSSTHGVEVMSVH